MKPPKGICSIYGYETLMTFEHIPPENAFNDRPIVYRTLQELSKIKSIEDMDSVRGRQQQRGSGGYTLCRKCNNDTGFWYGNGYASWAQQGLEVLGKIGGQETMLAMPFYIESLKVIKQIITMFFSLNNTLRLQYPYLVTAILNKDFKYLSPEVQIYAFYTLSTRGRGCPALASGNFGSHSTHFFSETTHLPFGYIMSLNSTPPVGDLCNISYFSKYDYKQMEQVFIRMPIKPIYTWIPADYRTRDKAISDYLKNTITSSGANQ